jgi:hypothetical protein
MDENTMGIVAILVGFGIMFLVYGATYFFAWLFSSSRTVVYVIPTAHPKNSNYQSASNSGRAFLGQNPGENVNVVLQAAAPPVTARARKARK